MLFRSLEVEIENDSSKEFDKILIKENPSDEIIEIVHSPETNTELITDTEVNLNSISFSESSSDISQLKVSIKNNNKIIEKISKEEYLNLIEVPLTFDLPEKKILKKIR